MNIQNTRDYKAFRLIKGNRPIIKNKVSKLVASFQSGIDLFPFCPVLVNKDMYVIDGQHRMEASKQLNRPVYFTVVPDFELKQIAQINEASNKWTIKDFFNCFIESGLKDYQTLMLFMEKYELVIGTSVSLLTHGHPYDSTNANQTFRNGQFTVKKMKEAEALMTLVMDYEDISQDKLCRKGDFIRAIYLLAKEDKYVHNEVVAKLKRNGSKIEYKPGYKEYIFHIEELFNKGNSKRQIIYG